MVSIISLNLLKYGHYSNIMSATFSKSCHHRSRFLHSQFSIWRYDIAHPTERGLHVICCEKHESQRHRKVTSRRGWPNLENWIVDSAEVVKKMPVNAPKQNTPIN
jgi:hypothetical protein